MDNINRKRAKMKNASKEQLIKELAEVKLKCYQQDSIISYLEIKTKAYEESIEKMLNLTKKEENK